MLLNLEIKTPNTPNVWYEDFFLFMQNNWGWIAGIAGVMFVILGGIFYIQKAGSRKRASAVGGFYPQLKIQLQLLKDDLNHNDRLNPEDEKLGNIFLIEYRYDNSLFPEIVPRYNRIEENEINVYKQPAELIIKTVETTENNINPLWTGRKKWELSLSKIVSICHTIANPVMQGQKEITDNPTYVKDGKELSEAIDYILAKLP